MPCEAIVEPSWKLPKAFTIMLFCYKNGKSEGDESCRGEDDHVRQNVQKPLENEEFRSILKPCEGTLEPSSELPKSTTILF